MPATTNPAQNGHEATPENLLDRKDLDEGFSMTQAGVQWRLGTSDVFVAGLQSKPATDLIKIKTVDCRVHIVAMEDHIPKALEPRV